MGGARYGRGSSFPSASWIDGSDCRGACFSFSSLAVAIPAMKYSPTLRSWELLNRDKGEVDSST